LAVSGCPGRLDKLRYTTAAIRQNCTLVANFSGGGSAGITDTLLRAAVVKRLGLTAGSDPSTADLARLTDLTVTDAKLSQLTGLEAAVNLTKLVISGTAVRDLAPITGLSKLATLEIARTPVTDLAPLTRLPLTRLDLSQTPVANLDPLASSNLRWLNLSASSVQDLTPVVARLTRGASLVLGTSGAGCLATRGYVRSPGQINQLRGKGVTVTFTDQGFRRSNCPNSLAGLMANTQGVIQPSGLELRWSLEGVKRTGPWRCELHSDLSFQRPGEPLVRIDNCQTSASLSYAQQLSGMPGVNLLVLDGLGGQRILPINPSRDASLGPAPALRIARIDYGQAIISTGLRLLAGRDTLLRVHALSSQATPVPTGSLAVSLPNGTRQTLSLTAPARLSSTLAAERDDAPYTAVIPAAWVEAGLNITLTLGDQTRTLVPQVGKRNPFYLTLVPMDIANRTVVLHDLAKLKASLLTFLPLSDVQIRVREPAKIAFSNPADLIGKLLQLRAQDGENSYYYGLLPDRTPGLGSFRGMARLSNFAGVGIDASIDTADAVIVHEIGHMISLLHVNCGNPAGVDLTYPYPGGLVGNLGVNLALNRVIKANTHKDLMSYCGPKHISDHSFTKAQAYLERRPSKPFATPAGAADEALARTAAEAPAQENAAPSSIFVHGEMGANGWQLSTLVSQQQPEPSDGEATEYSVHLVDHQGTHHSQPLVMPVFGHGDNPGGHFTASFPYLPAVRVEIWQGDTRLISQDLQTQAPTP
jgi:hypothetical protein